MYLQKAPDSICSNAEGLVYSPVLWSDADGETGKAGIDPIWHGYVEYIDLLEADWLMVWWHVDGAGPRVNRERLTLVTIHNAGKEMRTKLQTHREYDTA